MSTQKHEQLDFWVFPSTDIYESVWNRIVIDVRTFFDHRNPPKHQKDKTQINVVTSHLPDPPSPPCGTCKILFTKKDFRCTSWCRLSWLDLFGCWFDYLLAICCICLRFCMSTCCSLFWLVRWKTMEAFFQIIACLFLCLVSFSVFWWPV